jgi:hypothetical protein
MTTANAAEPQKTTATTTSQDAILKMIFGVAIFDLSGLPREYFITPDNDSTTWVQIVFQALGLKSLLMSSLKLDGCFHISIGFGQQTALVVRTKDSYVALLMQDKMNFASVEQADRFSQWVRQFEQKMLRQNPRFISA